MEYTGYSISTNNQLGELEAKHDLEVVQVRAEITAVQTEASDARALIKADLTSETNRAVAKEAELEAKINTEVADRVASVSAEQEARSQADSALDARLTSLEGWKTQNTDELAGYVNGEVDKAINTKVDQAFFDSVKVELENEDSALSQRISQHIVDRQNADATHREALTKSSDNDDKLKAVLMQMKNYLEAFSQTYTITDSNGNTVTADWSAMQGLLDGVQAHIVPAPAPSTV
jgi:hypothetical protein